eukprot:gnl/MRDRNA2_/MRDRNA2_52452_c0_seq1.p1 gnl/MRDRNA2_/MRDRNA2_52452_c0~~gnl/MRDRNA2_/MRDRNA2_52452_c0_seq1.p1  ORF type:complete len:705 (+),score=165.00 gnl/MRDRNA2_/MRDRNA2_52452_c0_seq1:41-2116(+)
MTDPNDDSETEEVSKPKGSESQVSFTGFTDEGNIKKAKSETALRQFDQDSATASEPGSARVWQVINGVKFPLRGGMRGVTDGQVRTRGPIDRTTRCRAINTAAQRSQKHLIERKWKTELDLNVGVDDLEAFKKFLIRKEHNYARAWRAMLDTANKGVLTKEDFCAVCRNLGITGDIRGIWTELNEGQGGEVDGVLTLRELDERTSDVLQRFYRKLRQAFPDMTSAFKYLNSSGARRISESDWCSAVTEGGLAQPKEAEVLFHLLCTTDSPTCAAVSEEELEWLDCLFHEHWESDMAIYEQRKSQAPDNEAFRRMALKRNARWTSAAERLYANAEERKQKRAEEWQQRFDMEEEQRKNLGGLRQVAGSYNPDTIKDTIERLYQEHQTKKEKRAQEAEEYYEQFAKYIITPDQRTLGLEEASEVANRLCQKAPIEYNNPIKEPPTATQMKGPKDSWRHNKLYEDHKRRKEKLEQAQKEKREQEEKAFVDSYEAFHEKARQKALCMKPDRRWHERMHKEAQNRKLRNEERCEADIRRQEMETKTVTKKVSAKDRIHTDAVFERLFSDQERKKNARQELMVSRRNEQLRTLEMLSVHRGCNRDEKIFQRLYQECPKRYYYGTLAHNKDPTHDTEYNPAAKWAFDKELYNHGHFEEGGYALSSGAWDSGWGNQPYEAWGETAYEAPAINNAAQQRR